MLHRGPDDAGLYFDGNVVLGHRRLSIIDLSAAGHQPMEIDGGDLVITFNGEIYNYLEIKKELEEKYDFQTKTDTEVILRAYKEWGAKCLEKFIGMFSFVIYDKKKNEFFGARDRLGIKPFYFFKNEDEFIFASEIKSILAMGIKAAPNDKIIYDYLAKGWYEHTDETFFLNINKLPAGHYFFLKGGNLEIKRYWDVAGIKENKNLSFDEAKEKTRALLEDAVRLRLRSDVPLGINVSGGLDSSCLITLVNNLAHSNDLNAFSMCYHDSKYDESPFIEALIKQFGNPWHRSFLEPDEALPMGEKLLEYEDEPYGGIPTISYFKMHNLAKEKGVIVLLEGQGVDELMAGYKYHLSPFYRDLLRSFKFSSLKQEAGYIAQEKNISKLKAFGVLLKMIFTGTEGKHFDYSNPLRPACLSDGFVEKFQNRQFSFRKPFKSELKNTLYKDVFYTKIPRVLRFNDRLAMAWGRELRVPYLDHRFVEFAFSLGGEFKIKKGKGKYLVRKAMIGDVLDDNVLTNKRSVVSPQTDWLQNELKEKVREIVLSKSFLGRGYFNPEKIKQELEKFYSFGANNSFFIWQWINLDLWFRKYID